MKTLILFLLTLGFVGAQERFVTLTDSKFELQQGEVAHLVSFPISINAASRTDPSDKRGIVVQLVQGPSYVYQVHRPYYGDDPSRTALTLDSFDPLVVVGPATLSVVPSGLATFKITPNTFEADKTVVVPPGTGGGKVQLECSTDLVHWTVSTNGIYTNLVTAKFFRIRLEKLQP